MSATQLGLDLTPIGAFAVGDRVRVLPTWHGLSLGFLSVRAGDVGTVTDVRPPATADDNRNGRWWAPVGVMMDSRPDPRHAYAFEHEDLELVSP